MQNIKFCIRKKSFIETMETAFCKSGYIYPIGDWVFLSHDYKAREKIQHSQLGKISPIEDIRRQ